ncbi:MAG: DNA polymerase III subunit delta [Candidatus Moranbacteria bacterium]|nr:DNA polymerase III subunit delta [Candidatus Moranbacteria bacterium]
MIIFLYGEDAFRSSQKLKEIKEKFLKSDPAASGLSVCDFGDKAKTEEVINILGTPNLLAPKRLVIIKNLIKNGTDTDQGKILEFIKKNKKDLETSRDLVVVFWEGEKIQKNNALGKILMAGKAQEFEKLSGLKLNQWINKRIKEIDIKAGISQPALDKLVLYAGNDMFLLDNEIQKLASYAGGKTISEEMVELLVKANLDSNIFNTIDALGAKNKREALKLLHRHLGQGEDPFYIFSMFIYQFRNLLKIADYKENSGMGEREIANVSKMHPYVVRKSLGQIQRFSFGQLKKIYAKLLALDVKIKTGKIDIQLALDKFIVEL